MHHIHPLPNPLFRRDCVSCPSRPPACNCNSNQNCILTSQSCDSCAVASCVDRAKPSSGGASQGALIGSIVGALVFLFLVLGAFFWWKRRAGRRSTAEPAATKEKNAMSSDPNTRPASAAASTRVSRMPSTRGLDVENNRGADPFSDTTSSHSGSRPSSRQAIPIGMESTSPTGTTFTVPVRPQRSPENQLKEDRVLSNQSLEPPRLNYAPSQRSGFTVDSVDSAASSAMDALYESPTIVTGGSRQVIGAVRAEVVQVGSTSGSAVTTPRSMSQTRRVQPGPSPLSTSFSRSTTFPPISEDPFADQASMRSQNTAATNMTFGVAGRMTPARTLSPKSATTVGSPLRMDGARTSLEDLSHPLAPGAGVGTPPGSVHTTARSSPSSNHSFAVDPYPGLPPPTRRNSNESFISSASRADSVLAAFPFVPPSPLPSSHAKSPLSVVFDPNRQSNGSSFTASSAPPLPTSRLPMVSHNAFPSNVPSSEDNTMLVPPSKEAPRRASRATNALSRVSTASSVLGGFHFQFDDGSVEAVPEMPPLNSGLFGHPDDQEYSLNARTKQPIAAEVGGTGEVGEDMVTPVEHVKTSSERTEEHRDVGGERATLDTLALSQAVAAHRLDYD
ncbi:uncharacterized protein EI90DRAFT_3015728 [Cantharellus anzutake]|uniref:uncharacterized protein n=1 Tax=Cantharellus anzutake TaxID=1750568 RepID=UPI0019057945|nr:uncharacterized protein EI90DRAFT_3015728 [Cantharellus anzutake]KAF8332678.1 hypothetical protein EI90DRAFT_3015728 [Cantharellus anzutake]